VQHVAVAVVDPERDADLAALARRLGLRVVGEPDAAPCTLARDARGLAFIIRDDTGTALVRIEPEHARPGLRRSTSLIARAVGGARGALVVDATAGLGRDAFELAALGYRVVACERHPLLAALLRDAIERAGAGIELHAADARDVLVALPRDAVHAVCLDPMFPPRDKRAAVRKEARLLQHLVGTEPDERDLLAAARACAGRVVVKRPRRAPPLAPDVTFAVAGRAVRFDVYVSAGARTPAR